MKTSHHGGRASGRKRRCPLCKKVRMRWMRPGFLNPGRRHWVKSPGMTFCWVCAFRMGIPLGVREVGWTPGSKPDLLVVSVIVG